MKRATPILLFDSRDAIAGNWFHVDLLLHYPDRTFDVTVTQLTGGSAGGTATGLPFTDASATDPDQISVVWFDNGDVARDGWNLFIDSLRVEAVPEPTNKEGKRQ